ncbi:hypothetical protein EYE42_06350 [Paracoccus subflavus]|uniref:Peptidase metallopeptidase domain-containing protein n=1 Tax=Paracoccus subflavus TaxID=2528244 RepID=A0A4V2JCI1_9RHOB|nr:M10 family metallopeptidase [Paracoccus subflavus]TBN42016.1 hypothetical protein EYE42_06350 [Paracoccus subflavus]
MEVYSPQRFADTLQRTLFSDGQKRTLSGAADDTVLVNTVDLTIREKALARAAWQEIAAITGLRFLETTGSADVTYVNDGTSTATTRVSYSGSSILRATVNISSDRVGSGDGIGSYAFRTYMHETAHALGLGHPQDYDVIRTFSQSDIANDSWQISIMSYFDQDENTRVNATYARQITPMLADYLALRDMYGAVPVRVGATTYGVNSTAGGALDKMASLGAMATFLIADTGGWDRVDFSTFAAGQFIDLRPGAISSVMGAVGNMQIAPGTIIEVAIGGAGGDRLIGNAASNVLDGRGGADRLEGGLGNDTYYYTAGDTVVEGPSAGLDRMLSFGSFALAANVESGQALGSAAVTVNGNALNNAIAGNAAANVLNGLGGNDTLRGGGGNDLYVTNGGDAIIEQAGAGVDTVRSSVNYALTAHVENLALMGTAVRGIGNALNNAIAGNAAGNVLNGLGGNDVLTGGGGADQFVFGDGLDRVRDFQDDVDTLMFIGSQLGVSTTAQAMSHAVQSGSNVIFDFGADDLIVLNTTIAALQNDVGII